MLWKAINGNDANNIYQWGERHARSQLLNAIFDAVNNDKNILTYNGEKINISQIDTNISGFVGFAFWLLLRAIKYHNSYQDAILEVVKYGGDTDTNACIVGAVIGALYPETIPRIWIDNIITCSAKKKICRLSNS